METSETNYTALGGPPSYLWLVAAIISLLCFSFGGIIIGQYSFYPFHLKLLGSLSFLVISILMIVYFAIEFALKHKRMPRCTDANVFKGGKLAPGALIGFLGGIPNALGQMSYMLGWYYDENGRGIIICIMSASTVLTSVLAYFFYNERLTLCEVLGMLVTTGGMVVISIESSFDGTWVAYLGGLGSLILFGLRNLIGKKMHVEGLDSYTGGIVNQLGDATVGLILLVVLCVPSVDFDFVQSGFDFWTPFAGLLIIATGAFFINQAIMLGKVGISLTICNTQGAVFMLLEFLFFGVIPSPVKLAGALVIIAGIVILFLGDSLLDLLRGKAK